MASLCLLLLIGLAGGVLFKWAFSGPWAPPFDGE
jgi:hypothetical protein